MTAARQRGQRCLHRRLRVDCGRDDRLGPDDQRRMRGERHAGSGEYSARRAAGSAPGTNLSDCGILPCTAATRSVGVASVRAGQKLQASAQAAITAMAARPASTPEPRTGRMRKAYAAYAPITHSTNVMPYVPAKAARGAKGRRDLGVAEAAERQRRVPRSLPRAATPSPQMRQRRRAVRSARTIRLRRRRPPAASATRKPAKPKPINPSTSAGPSASKNPNGAINAPAVSPNHAKLIVK